MVESKTRTTSLGSKYALLVAMGGFFASFILMFTQSAWMLNIAYAAEDLGVKVAQLAIVSSAYGVCFGGSGFLWGWICDRFGLRVNFAVGTILISICALCFGLFGKSPAIMALIYGLMGIGMGSTSPAVVAKLCGTWFDASRRGLGVSIVTIGGNVAGMLSGLILPIFIANQGWRGCYVTLSVICFCMAILCFLLIRDQPAVVGTVPFGSPEGTEVKDTSIATKKITKEDWIAILKMPITWKMGIVYILWTLWFTSQTTFLFASVRTLGFAAAVVGLSLTIQRIGSFGGMWIWPSLADHITKKTVLGVLCICCGIWFFIMRFFLNTGSSSMTVYVFIAISGLLGASTPVMQSQLSDCYPPSIRGSGSGVVSTLTLIGRLGGPIVAGMVVTAMGGYNWDFVYLAGPCIILTGVLAMLILPKTGGKFGDPVAEAERIAYAKTAEEQAAEMSLT